MRRRLEAQEVILLDHYTEHIHRGAESRSKTLSVAPGGVLEHSGQSRRSAHLINSCKTAAHSECDLEHLSVSGNLLRDDTAENRFPRVIVNNTKLPSETSISSKFQAPDTELGPHSTGDLHPEHRL